MNTIARLNHSILNKIKKAVLDLSSPRPVQQDNFHNYRIGGMEIQLPDDHLLPLLRQQHVNYDRFLPILAEQLSEDAVIVDVGANCGDTLAGMVSRNIGSSYICIEPDKLFYDLLCKNAAKMRSVYESHSITLVNSLVGNCAQPAILEGSGGTKQAVHSISGDLKYQKLDSIIEGLNTSNVRLIKVDVDGFDFDVLNSASKVIDNFAPILFFECASSSKEQTDGFKSSILSLSSRGYSNWTVFDNFGSLILRNASHCSVLQLIDYVDNQNAGLATRTIYYFDIVAAKLSDANLVGSAIDAFTLSASKSL